MLKKVVYLAICVSALASAAMGCAFHTYVPQPTMVDRLLTSDHIVLARADPDDPFRFKAVTALEGPLADVELPHLVDTATRRRFAVDPNAHVLFARDGSYGPWERVAYVGAEMQPVLDVVMSNLPIWGGVDDDRGRYEYFATLIGSADPQIRRLALRELDQANYRVFRTLSVEPNPEALAARLYVLNEMGLAPIRILLLGLSEGPGVGDLLRTGVDRNKSSGATALLGAYATAWLEHSGAFAAQSLASDYLLDRTLPIEAREMIVEAMAIHSDVREPEVAEVVRQAVASAVRSDPDLAPVAARQFGIRNDWSLSSPISEVLRANRISSVADIILVSQYVALADEADVIEAN